MIQVVDVIATLLWRRDPPTPLTWPRGVGGKVLGVLYTVVLVWLAILAGVLFSLPDVGQGVVTAVTAAAMAVALRRSLVGWRIVMAAQIGELFLPALPINPPTIVGVAGVLVVVGLRCPAPVAAATGVLCVLVNLPAWWGNAVAIVPLLLMMNVRARHVAGLELAAEQRQAASALAERAVFAERARIAREMHDVVAHHMSLIAVRCESAPYRITGLDDEARTELGEVASAAREAMAEMQSLLGVLRSSDDPAENAPQPGLEQLPRLLSDAVGSGADVTWSATVDQRDVPAALGLTVFRVVQQSITNAAQHAPGAAVSVLVERAEGQLHVEVRNGPGAPTAASGRGGQGLIGMRERVALHGGRLRTGPTADGGFAVSAQLPLPESRIA